MNKEQRYVIGFGLVRLMTGLKNFWSVTRPYHLSRLYLYDLSIRPNDLDLVMSLATLFEFLGMAIGFKVFDFLGARALSIICLIGVSLGFLNCHFVTLKLDFEIFYPFTTGFFCGLTAVTLVYPLWQRFKQRAGLALAASRGFFILGIIPVFPLLKIVNPYGQGPEKVRKTEFYPESMMGRFSETMAYYCAIITGLGIIGVLILNRTLRDNDEKRQMLLKPKKKETFARDTLEKMMVQNEDDLRNTMSETKLLVKGEMQNSGLKVAAVGVALAVMTLHTIYYEHRYIEYSITEKHPFLTLVFVLFAVFVVGWAYDAYKEYTFYFGYSALLGFLLHSYIFYYLVLGNHESGSMPLGNGGANIPGNASLPPVTYEVKLTNEVAMEFLYVFFSVLTNIIEIVIAMTLLKIADGRINCQFALKAFSLTAIGGVISCLLHIYFEIVFEKFNHWSIEPSISTIITLSALFFLFAMSRSIQIT